MEILSPLDNTALPLVLLGGTLCTARLWQPVINQLNASSVICVTLTGAETAHAMSKRLLTALPPRFCLVGFSLGAIVALQMLADAPQRIGGLALLSVNPLADAPENAASRRAAVKTASALGLSRWLRETLWLRYVAPQRADDSALQQTILEMAEACGVETFARQTEIAITRHDHRSLLRAFTAPVLIINGAEDVICTPILHEATASAAPGARWITLPDCGHFFPLEAPEPTAATLHQWLMEILS